MIESIELVNWKTHGETRLSFQKGVNVLIGIMGAGKSSTMDAISYALFGDFPSLNSGRVKLGGIVSTRPGAGTDATVRLRFSSGGKSYTVTRKVSGKRGSTATLEVDGAYLQSQPSKVTEEISSILKMDYDMFSRAVYSDQNRLEYFLELAGGDRKRQIDAMLGLDAFTNAETNTTSLINAIRSKIKDAEEALATTDSKAIRDELSDLRAEAGKLSEAQASQKARETELRVKLEESRAKYEAANKELQRRKALEKDLAALGSRISTLKEEISRINALVKADEASISKEYEAAVAAKKELSKKTADSREAERQAQKILAELEARVRMDREKLDEKSRLMKEAGNWSPEAAKAKLDAESNSLQALLKESASMSGRLEELNRALKDLRGHISRCPVCDRELDERTKAGLLAAKSKEAEGTRAAIKEMEDRAAERSAKLRQLNEVYNGMIVAHKRLAGYDGIEASLERDSKMLTKAKSELDVLSKDRKALEERLESAGQGLIQLESTLKKIEDRRARELEVQRASSELEKKAKEASEIKVDDAALEKLRELLTVNEKELAALSEKIKGDSEKIAMKLKQAAEKEKQLADFSKSEARIARRRGQVTNLNNFKAALVETDTELRAMTVGTINSLMQGLWSRLYPYGDYTGLRLSAAPNDYILELCIGASGAWAPVDTIASGGERSIAALAMRIAMAMVMVPNLKWLILDEPTHNIDSTGISKLVEVMGGALPSIVEQIFVITHDESLKQISSARVYQFDRDKGAGGPTTISML